MTIRTLDRSRPFGEVCGDHEQGACHEQDGAIFDADDVFIGGKALAPVATAEKRDATSEEMQAQIDELTAQLAALTGAAAPVAPTNGSGGKSREEQEAELQGMHAAPIKKLVESGGMTPVAGRGAKAANIELLLNAEFG